MSNTLLWFIMLTVNFTMIMASFRLLGKTGLYVWMPISCIIANIQVTKTVILFGLEATLGNIVYATGFLATDILAEFYGKKEADKAVSVGLVSIVCMTVLMQMAILFKPSPNDISSPALKTIFTMMPRITLASLTAYAVSNFHDVRAFLFWKKKTDGKHLWLRNNFSTIVSQAIDTIIFTLGAFLFKYELFTLIEIMISTYLLKFITALCDTAMIYLAKRWVTNGCISDIAL